MRTGKQRQDSLRSYWSEYRVTLLRTRHGNLSNTVYIRLTPWNMFGLTNVRQVTSNLFSFHILIMRPSYRPHYASCPTVCPSVPNGLVTGKQKKNEEKSKLTQKFPGHVQVNCQFSVKKTKVKVTGCQNHTK